MSDQIIGLQDWLQTPPGRYLLDWERTQVDRAVADIFGYHAVQLGLPELGGLQHNRMPHRWLATQQLPLSPPNAEPRSNSLETEHVALALVTDFEALPFPAASLDLVLLPHTLEFSDAHATLREVERVLVPEGRVVICGFSPTSFWALRRARQQLWRLLGLRRFVGPDYLPLQDSFLGVWRLRDWLRLLGFEVELVRYGCYAPAVSSLPWLQRFAWLDRLGARWWPVFGAAYLLVAVKKVRGTRLLGAAWKAAPVRAASPVVAGQRRQDMTKKEEKK
ncbi:MAG: methyltransferase domain-containing protein [Rhodoferax sp.]|nr:methyltransferase domain-containing protein [Rhodoferax sp.]